MQVIRVKGTHINSDINSILSFNRKTRIFLISTGNDHNDDFVLDSSEYSNTLLQKCWKKSSISSLYNSSLCLCAKKGTYGN